LRGKPEGRAMLTIYMFEKGKQIIHRFDLESLENACLRHRFDLIDQTVFRLIALQVACHVVL